MRTRAGGGTSDCRSFRPGLPVQLRCRQPSWTFRRARCPKSSHPNAPDSPEPDAQQDRPQPLPELYRRYWRIEATHFISDLGGGEDRSRARTGRRPANATPFLRIASGQLMRRGKEVPETIGAMTRKPSRDLDMLGMTGNTRPLTTPTESVHRRSHGPLERTATIKPAQTMPAGRSNRESMLRNTDKAVPANRAQAVNRHQGVWKCRANPSEHAAQLDRIAFNHAGTAGNAAPAGRDCTACLWMGTEGRSGWHRLCL